MKEILMSIRPEWCKLIFSGEKTIEVRKTAPTLYDKPRELGEFRKVCLNGKCSDCIYEECKITRAPMSWCYVEELQ